MPSMIPDVSPSANEPKPPMAAEHKKPAPKHSEHGNTPPETRDYHQNTFKIKCRPLG